MSTHQDARLMRLLARRDEQSRERETRINRRKAIVDGAENERRDNLSPDEDAEFLVLTNGVKDNDATIKQLDERINELTEEKQAAEGRSPAAAAIRAAQARGSGRVDLPPSLVPSVSELDELGNAARSRQPFGLEVRATVSLSQVGGAIDTGDGTIPEPRRIVAAVGMPATPVPMRGWSGAKYGTEATAGATAESGAKPEYDAVTQLDLVPQAWARWSDVTVQAIEGMGGLRDISAAHGRQIAMDEDAYVIGAMSTEAGTPVVFDADVKGNVMGAMAEVETTVSAPCDVLVVNPADYALFAGTTPANADDVASHVIRFNGAQVYASTSQTAGIVLVASLRAAGKYVVHGGLDVAVQAALKTNVVTIRSELFSAFGFGVAGAVKAIDVVTP